MRQIINLLAKVLLKKLINIHNSTTTCLVLGGLAMFIAGDLLAKEYTLKVHHFLSTKSATHKGLLVPWADRINQASNGKLQLNIYPAMQLGGKPPQLFDQARRGTVDIAWTLAGYTPGRFPRMEVFELPFMATNAEVTSQAAYEFYRKYAQEDFKDVKVLLVHTHGPGKFHMNKKPIRNLQDLKGTKVRTPTRIAHMMLTSLGASSVGMPVPELPGSLARGVVDGALVPYEVALPLRLHELTDSHTDITGDRGLYTAVFILVMNKKKFNSLPAEMQKILEDNSGLAWAKDAGKLWDRSDLLGLEAARGKGNKFYFISGKELKKWQVIGTKVWRQWENEMTDKNIDGKALIKHAQRLIRKFEKAQ
ncbi:MAG: TRAP transporter substrate-binding protein [Candidatus Portiera sp.]|nr:TRAP transporter substrate-binding protein [Portiera sp.]